MKSILRHPDFEDKDFTLDCLTPEIKKLRTDLIETYNLIPSTEIWNTECVNSIIFQVKSSPFFHHFYFREFAAFKYYFYEVVLGDNQMLGIIEWVKNCLYTTFRG